MHQNGIYQDIGFYQCTVCNRIHCRSLVYSFEGNQCLIHFLGVSLKYYSVGVVLGNVDCGSFGRSLGALH